MGKGTPNTSPRNTGLDSGSLSDSGAKRSPRQRFGASIQRGLSRVFNTRSSAGSSGSSPRSDDEASVDDSRNTTALESTDKSNASLGDLPAGFKLSLPEKVVGKEDPQQEPPPISVQAEPKAQMPKSSSSSTSDCSVVAIEATPEPIQPSRRPLFLDETIAIRNLGIREICPNSPAARGQFFQQPDLEGLDWYYASNLIDLFTVRNVDYKYNYHVAAYNLLAGLCSQVLNPAFLNISNNIILFNTLRVYFGQIADQIINVEPQEGHLKMLLEDEICLLDETAEMSFFLARQRGREALTVYVNQLLLPYMFKELKFENHRLQTSLAYLWQSLTGLGLEEQYNLMIGELFSAMVNYLDERLQLDKARRDLMENKAVDGFVRLSTLLNERFVGRGAEMAKRLADAMRTSSNIITLADTDLFFPVASGRINQIRLSLELLETLKDERHVEKGEASPATEESLRHAQEESFIQYLIELLRPEQLVMDRDASSDELSHSI